MSMEKLIEEVKECVEREYGRAGAKFGLVNHSDHESYAIILEEFQEAETEVALVNTHLSQFWDSVKLNDDDQSKFDKFDKLMKIERNAVLGACELIQVAAMAEKAAMTMCQRGAFSELEEGGRSE